MDKHKEDHVKYYIWGYEDVETSERSAAMVFSMAV